MSCSSACRSLSATTSFRTRRCITRSTRSASQKRSRRAVFNEIHVKKNYLLTPQAQADFLATQGVDKKKYMEAYNSFSTQSAIQRDSKLMQDYKIDGVPTLVVQGKYETGPAATNSLPGTTQVLDYLVAQVRAKKM